MNSLTVQGLAQLSPRMRREVAARASDWGVVHGFSMG